MSIGGQASTPPARDADREETQSRGLLVVVSGPSGVGKGTLLRRVQDLAPQMWLSVSATTRSPRAGEVHGDSYLFLSEEEFAALVDSSGLLEHARYAGRWYGTPREPVLEHLAAGQNVLLEIDVAGAQQVRAAWPDALLVFVAAPSWTDLVARLAGRGTEDPAEQARRLAVAEQEMRAVGDFDEVVVNDEVDRAAAELLALVRSYR